MQNTQQHHYVPLPLAIGGISSIDEAINTIRLGADKVAINTSAIESPRLLDALSEIRKASFDTSS